MKLFTQTDQNAAEYVSVHLHLLIKVHIFSSSIRNNVFVIFLLIITGVFWLHRLFKFIYNVCCYWEIRSFYINALKMTMVSQTNTVMGFVLFTLNGSSKIYYSLRWKYLVSCRLHRAFSFQSELPYATWQEVQARIVVIQKEHQICIHKKELSELDIYHRILRFKNYMVCLFVMKS